MQRFEPVDPKVNFPELERRILEFWRDRDVFARSIELRKDDPLWVFSEGPPTANGTPGIHHVEARVFKDVYPRFKTMTGHFVPRKGGWDCHGLPVELEVEKEIGTTGKRDIEAFGIAEFNRLCRESVTRYVGEFEQLTDRIGFWIDMSDAYWTMNTEYIESVWWSLKRLHQRGLLVESDKVTAYCPRCGTALSDAEVAMGYQTVEDPSVFVRFRVAASANEALSDPRGVSLLVWTTTPWTLPSNEGLAVDNRASYAVVKVHDELFVVGTSLRERVLGTEGEVVATLRGSDLVGVRYEPLYPNVEGAHEVVAGEFVSMDEGTGIVHIAPAFGPEDLAIGRAQGWPIFKPVDDAGRFNDLGPAFIRGVFVKEADPKIIEDLTERGVLLRAETIEHAYPFCWRCGTPLLYYARSAWYARTTAVKERLLEVNESVNWFPDHIKHGRYGDWLENNVDWALSRERYWGTPLPIWRCAAGHQTAVGSLAELGELAGRDVSDVDPHRPAIDEVTFPCPECGGTATRVLEVIDTWYDSGAMSFAQWSYHPELGRGAELFAERFPADFISEAIDQTRGWFYTLMAEGVLHFDSTAYRNVVCLGHLVAADGRKMSKSLGNALDPWEVLDRQGADALRWFMIASGSPWEPRRIGHEVLDEIVRQFLLTLWNVYSFFVTYANAESFDPSEAAPAPADRPALDRWALSQLADTVRVARDGLERYDATSAGRRIAAFVDDLSNWYVRRARRRFWNPAGGDGDDADGRAAFHTLHTCLVTLAQLLAPFTPFISEELWRNLAADHDGSRMSVHLSDYPIAHDAATDAGLDEAMAAARAIVELGRRIRVETKTRTRQPLLEAVVHHPGDHRALMDLLPLVQDELNVKIVTFAESDASFGNWRAKPNYKVLGPRLGNRVKEIAALLAADDGTIASELASGTGVVVVVGGESIPLTADDVDLVQEVSEGWGVASDGGITVALELEINDALRREGLARELVRAIQEARKIAGLNVSDRIELGVVGNDDTIASLDDFDRYIEKETLATRLQIGVALEGDAFHHDVEIDGETMSITLRRAARPSA